jgi:hypothetical protein
MIGTKYVVHAWERGTVSTTTGEESDSPSNLRSGYIDVNPGERYIAQLLNGASVTMAYFYYAADMSFLSNTSTSGAVTIPANAAKMRVRASSSADPQAYTGNVYPGTVRQDYSKGNTLYSALLMQKDLINLRVAKDDVINQINISTEGILIAGNKVRITGQTTIDNAVIQTAMIANLAVTTAKIADLAVSTAKIADAAITNAKIANLDAGKINAGTISADRIAAGSITSNKLTVANGFITNAMIADATIQSAKIAAIDAGKITTGTLNAGRIAANSITADKLATNAIQVGLANWTNTIRITPADIKWYNVNALYGTLNAHGISFTNTVSTADAISIGVQRGNINGVYVCHLMFTLYNGGHTFRWVYENGNSFSTIVNMDPRGYYEANQPGVHFWRTIYTHGYSIINTRGDGIYLGDNEVDGEIFPSWSGPDGNARLTFGDRHLYLVTDGYYYNCTNIVIRLNDLMLRVNEIIRRLNYGWVASAIGATTTWAETGLTEMDTTL